MLVATPGALVAHPWPSWAYSQPLVNVCVLQHFCLLFQVGLEHARGVLVAFPSLMLASV